ncbi:hypothetical protein AB0C07_22930 [Actinoplanes missouriensis]|uniref:hypothetical protein n=1 Tax=Actinoplanes missouriensis TaxID=1866 RepID=UPI0033CB25AD
MGGFLPAVPALVAVVQVLAEGFRWQMVPGHALALALPVAWLRRRATAGRFALRGWAARTATVAGLAGCMIVLVMSVALPVVVPVSQFPAPSGRYGIGTVTYHWVDQSRPELFTADPADQREPARLPQHAGACE